MCQNVGGQYYDLGETRNEDFSGDPAKGNLNWTFSGTDSGVTRYCIPFCLQQEFLKNDINSFNFFL